jgi:tetratricopeptide (TPR) repeat protein
MPAKCDICGIETKVKEAFYLIGDESSIHARRRCPQCWMKKQTGAAKRAFFAYFCAAAIGLILVFSTADNTFGWFLLNLVLYYLLMIVAALPHELGHAFVAKAVGFRVFHISIGYGRTIFERPFCGFNFQLKSIPFGGFAFSTPKNSKSYRVKKCLVVLAGPSANLLIAAMLAVMIPDQALSFDFNNGINLPGVFFVANMVSFGYSLVPHYFESVFGKIPNDGQIILKTLSIKKPAIEALPVYYYLYESVECCKRKQLQMAGEWIEKGLVLFPDYVTLLDRRGALLTYQKQFSEARSVFLQLLSRPNVHAYHRCYYANNLAWVDALIGGDELIQEADKYSAEALENMPHVSYFKGTRGTVLVEMGRFDEGLKLLKEAMASAMDSTSKALNACHIAIAEHRRGNLEEGQKYAAIARSLDSDCILLDRLPAARAPQSA